MVLSGSESENRRGMSIPRDKFCGSDKSGMVY